MAANLAVILNADEPLPLKSPLISIRARERPPPANWYMDNLEDTQLGPLVNKVAHRESKIGLRSMFGLHKVDPDMKHVFIPPIEESIPQGRPKNQTPSLASKKDIESETTSMSTRGSADSVSVAGEALLGLRLSITPKPKSSKATPISSTKSANRTSSIPPRRNSATWDPPPLFQAYPQAIKHAQLTSSTLSVDSILRVSNHKRNLSSRDDTNILNTDVSLTSATRKPEKLRSKHRRRLSGSSSKADWTEKIYVLVTSGYLLQYSGEGSFDRLPEKMLQLGKDSVAFASDVIPGKHWVLQISQAMDSDGTAAPDARSLLSRLNFRSSDYRRNATSFLLILDSPEELESWITTVRREIEALGGKKYVSETGKPKIEDEVRQLKDRPSQRYLVRRDPDRFSNPSTPRELSSDSLWRQPLDQAHLDLTAVSIKSHQTLVASPNRYSLATSSGSHDSQQPEPFRDNSYRHSYMSSGQRTLVTSQSSSPACSPILDTFKSLEESQLNQLSEEIRPRPNATAISERRRSIQMIQNPAIDFLATARTPYNRPYSIYGSSSRTVQVSSDLTQNLNISYAVSKRYNMVQPPEIMEAMSSTDSKTPNKALGVVKIEKKSPSAPSAVRPLSPVPASPSKMGPLVYTPTGSQNASERRPSIVDVSTHTPSGLPSFTKSPPQTSCCPSIMPPTIPQKSPRRYSVQPQPQLSHGVSIVQSTHEIPAYMVPLPPSPPTQSSVLHNPIVNKARSSSRAHVQRPIVPNTLKSRRPASTQVLIQASTISTRKTIPPPNGTLTAISPTSRNAPRSLLYSTSIQSAHISPPRVSSRQRLKPNADARKDLKGPRSMPHLLNSPPPAPPPNCALPPIPTGMKSPLAMKSSRSSVKV